MSKTGQLAGLTVLITRPRHQAGGFCKLIEAEGGRALRYPVIEIADVDNQALIQQQIAAISVCDFLIFISANAVAKGLSFVRPIMSDRTSIAAIGSKTAQALDNHKINVTVLPQSGMNSEALLEHPLLQDLTGRQVVIVRGGDGRGLLEKTLAQRGAVVTVLDVYQRSIPKNYPALAPMLAQTDVVAITSNEGLENLFTMVDSQTRQLLLHKPLLAGSGRVLELASELGMTADHVAAESPADDAMLEALINWVQSGDQTSVR